MKLIIDKNKFKKHINNISRGMTAFSPLKSLQGVHIDATEENLTLVTSDGNLSIKEVIKNNEGIIIKEPGTILVPSKLFKSIIDKMGDSIEIVAGSSKMSFLSEATKTEVNLFNVEDYPKISFETFGKDLIIDADEFKKMIKNVAFAAAFDNRRLILNGVNIKANNNKLIVTATNSFRLAQETKNIDSAIDFEINIIAKKIKDFLPSEVTGKIIINVDNTKIISKITQTTISSRIIDGIFPNVEKIIAKEFATEIKIDIRELEKNIDRVILVSYGGKKTIKLICDHNQFLLESEKSEIGIAKTKISNFNFTGQPIEIVFNYIYLKEAISKFQEKITIGFNGPQKPFVIKGHSNPDLIQLIMPHRT